MSTVIGIILTVGMIAVVGYLGYGIVVDIIAKVKKKKNNEKGGKST